MSGMETVGLVACVQGIVSAYQDGSAIVERIKVRRAAKRAPPPPRLLEESIQSAPDEIEKEKRRGIQRFGQRFEAGDHIVVIALQQITIQLQGKLLDKLRRAAFEDEPLDHNALTDEADLARDRTISALLEYRQRLLHAAAISQLEVNAATDSHLSVPAVSPTIIKSSEETSPIPTPRPHKTWTREYSSSRDASGEEDAASGADDAHSVAHRKRHSSLLGFLNRHHRAHSTGREDTPKIIEELQNSTKPTVSIPFRPPAQCDASEPPQPPSEQSQPEGKNSFQYHNWEDGPVELWGSKPSGPERRDTVIAPDMQSPNQLSPVSTNTARTHSMATLQHTNSYAHSTTSTAIPTPTPDNDYLGFCKSAWKLQNGDRKAAMHKTRAYDVVYSNVYFLACSSSKCAFMGHVDIEKIWTKVWNVESKGIKFRWPFLAKSHVPQQKVKDHQYAYQCMFCVFTGEKSPVYFGTDTYLAHVHEHRSQAMGDVIYYKTKCIADHIATDDEEFDINLMPITFEEQAERRQSEVLSDDLLNADGGSKHSTDGVDSMTSSNEPWNAGLSNFHWGGDMERVELE